MNKGPYNLPEWWAEKYIVPNCGQVHCTEPLNRGECKPICWERYRKRSEMRQITLEDCRNLKSKFDQYCETAEQHEFLTLIIVQTKLYATIKMIEEDGEVRNQKEARAMFRTVLRIIGENADEYEEGGTE